MDESVSVGFRENTRNPGHVRVSVFVGRNEGARGHSGEIVIRTDEWDELVDRINRGGLDDYVTVIPRPGLKHSDEEVARDRIDVEMMRRIYLWPMGDRLPLKRREGPEKNVQFGMLWAGMGPIVFTGGSRPGQVDASAVSYAGFEDVVDDGWVVD